MKIAALIQTRFNSTRLPGKAIMDFNGLPLTIHIYRRLLKCSELDGVIVAIGDSENSDRIIDVCERYGVQWGLESEEDLLQRLLRSATEYCRHYDAIVRITGDCIFHDPFHIDKMVWNYRMFYPQWDIIANWPERTLSEGLDAEVIGTHVLASLDRDPSCPRENFMAYAIANRDSKYKVQSYSTWHNDGDVHLSVDTPEDADRTRKMLAILGNDDWTYSNTMKAYREVVGVSQR